MKKLNIVGEKYRKLLVVEEVSPKKNNRMVKCLCDCGNTTVVSISNLRASRVVSCGCHKKEVCRSRSTTHHQRHTHLYEVWKSMKQRCYNTKSSSYKNYGARGILVCDEWLNDFQSFYKWSYENGYSIQKKRDEKSKLTLDRINVNGNYEPSNCRWVTRKIQSQNLRCNRMITYNNDTHCISEWSEILGINYHTLHTRLSNNWSIERAFETPVRNKSIK